MHNRRCEKDYYLITQPSRKPIGQGTSAVVYRARSTSTRRPRVAVKVYVREEEGEILRERESHILLNLPPHENIVRLIRNVAPRTWLTPTFSCPYGALIFRDAGVSLRSVMIGDAEADAEPEQPSLPWLLHLFQQIVSAVAHMHASIISHGDLKPDNIMVRPAPGNPSLPHATLIDMGHARLLPFRGVKITAHELSPEYAAPEVVEAWMAAMLTPSPHVRMGYDPLKADVWSLGCIGYFLMNRGKLPTDEIVAMKDLPAARLALLEHRRKNWPWPPLPEDARCHGEFITAMMQPRPESRFSLPGHEEDRAGAGGAPTGPGPGEEGGRHDAMDLIPVWTRAAD